MKTFLVGGAVRDVLMGREPKDLDYVVVGATPADMLAAGYQQVGADFPVFLHPETGHEYALARMERKTGDGYLGFEVQTDGVTLEDDLYRRDLTINAMALDEDGKLVDPYGGQHDLAQGVLRHVSGAFVEDPLRVIRLARFFARYDTFTVAGETMELCAQVVERGDLNHLATERFWAELVKAFEERGVERFFALLKVLNVDEHVNFFKGFYEHGVMHYDRLMQVNAYARIVAAPKLVPATEKVMFHTALAATLFIQRAAHRDTQALHANLTALRKLSEGRITADRIYALLKATKAWGEGTAQEDLETAALYAKMAGESFAISVLDLMHAVTAVRKVTAADYINELGPGKALGLAIEKGRKEAIAKLFNLRDDDIPLQPEV